MLPPPTTIATWTPRWVTCLTAVAMASMRAGSAPYSSPPSSASPESFSRTRRKAALPLPAAPSFATRLLLSHLEAGEAPDHDVLAGAGRELGAQLLDRLAAVLVLVDMLLLQEHGLLQPLPQASLDHLLLHLLRLTVVGGLLSQDASFGLADLLRHVLLGDVLRRHGGHVQSDVPGELLEGLGTRHEVGLAVDLDEHADLAVRVHVARHDPFRGGAPAALGGLRLALHAEDLDGPVDVPAGFLERGLAVHHGGPGALAQRLDLLGANGWAHEPSSSGSNVRRSRGAAAATSGLVPG